MAVYAICYYCNKKFDRSKEACVKVNSRRYAHAECANNLSAQQKQDQADKEALENYIITKFQMPYIDGRNQQLIKKFLTEYKYTYGGILRALMYWFDVKHNSIEKSNGGIGIVPYIYEESQKYYQLLLAAQMVNQDKEVTKPKEITVYIHPPERKTKFRKLFSNIEEDDV